MMGDRARTFALVVCLIILATILATLSVGIVPSQAGTTHANPSSPLTGTILVRAFMSQGTNNSSVGVPISDANITISRSSSLPFLPVVFQTNSSGEFEIPLGAGSYSILIWNSLFRQRADAVVQLSRITEVEVNVTRHSYPILFADLPDADSSGSVAPWSYVSVGVNSSVQLPLNGSLFMDGSYGYMVTILGLPGQSGNLSVASGPFQIAPTTASGDPVDVPVRLISSGVGPSGILWLTLQPESFFPISGLVSLGLATYSSELQVTLIAT